MPCSERVIPGRFRSRKTQWHGTIQNDKRRRKVDLQRGVLRAGNYEAAYHEA